MATRAAIDGIDAAARKRIAAATADIVARLGIEEPGAPPPARQPELQRAYELERFAALLESVAGALPDPKAGKAQDKPAEKKAAKS